MNRVTYGFGAAVAAAGPGRVAPAPSAKTARERLFGDGYAVSKVNTADGLGFTAGEPFDEAPVGVQDNAAVEQEIVHYSLGENCFAAVGGALYQRPFGRDYSLF